MSIVAALDKVLFFNASSKYSVLRMKTEDSSVPTEARSPYRYHDHLIRFTAVGIELPQTDTVKIEMDGEWKDGKYGLQLQVDHWQEIVPPTLEGVRNYLASGLLKGIGEKTADAIIEKFGVNALEILEHQPDRLLEIRGITKERLAEIKDAYAETSRMRVLMTLLAPFKVTPTTAQKIYQHFGPACADIVRQSPFNLCQVPGFGFKRIDAIVQKSGGDLRDPKRVHGALFYALEDARTKDGHLYLEAEALLKAAMQLLNERIPLPQMRVPMSQVEQELSAMIRQDEVVTRNLLYTAITRAKRRVLLVGEKRALYMAIHRSRKGKRNTMLGERIALYPHVYPRLQPRVTDGGAHGRERHSDRRGRGADLRLLPRPTLLALSQRQGRHHRVPQVCVLSPPPRDQLCHP